MNLPSGANLGIALSLSTATFWAISPMFMASVGRRVGSYHTNLLRLLLSSSILMLIVLPVYLMATWPRVAAPTSPQFWWLAASSMAGMVLGDACFYECLVRLGARRAVKLLTLAPVLALGLGWFWLGEKITPLALLGAAMVIGGIMYATMIDPGLPGHAPTREPGRVTAGGLAFGVAGAIGGALGAVLMRRAFQAPAGAGPGTLSGLDAIVAATIRVSAAAAVMWTIAVLAGDAQRVTGHLKDRSLSLRLMIGTLLGPVGGILCYVSAMKHAPAGLVSTLSSTSPLLILPLTVWKYKVRLRVDVILATLVAVAGVALISLGT